DQLDNYIHDMRNDEIFISLKDVGELSLKLVELKKHTTYDLVYLLIKLVLILPVATTSVERTFSAMTYVKNKLRNSIGDQFLNDCLVTYIENKSDGGYGNEELTVTVAVLVFGEKGTESLKF
ncbi:zinc finger MYM-type protein 1-like protein, partial [Tanacetum coccineum]